MSGRESEPVHDGDGFELDAETSAPARDARDADAQRGTAWAPGLDRSGADEALPAPAHLAASAKGDPESFALRGRPRPVVRFRRGVIVGVAGGLAAALATVAWLALEPPGFHLAVPGAGEALSPHGTLPDALSGAPESYGEVPQLGPPLPGDLGRPILEHQRELEAEARGEFASAGIADELAAAEAARQRRDAERLAARASPVMVQVLARSEGAGVGPETSGGRAASGDSPGDRSTAATMVQPLASPWTLSAGTVISASLISGVNSDIPGIVLAQVTEPVRDSATGRTVLIPQGARLIGKYETAVAFGQRRALLVWQRIVLPDGASLALDDLPVADLAGYAGVADAVDFHTWRLLKGIGLSTLLGVGTEIGLGSHEGDLVRAVRESAQQNAGRAGDQITARNLDIRPTITVRPGWPVRAIVNRDLVLEPWRG